MKYLVFIYGLLAHDNPMIHVEQKNYHYGESIKVSVMNTTSNKIHFYVDMDVSNGRHWGTADYDIENPKQGDLINYKTLEPGESKIIFYNTKNMPRLFVENSSVYSFSIHYIINMKNSVEKEKVVATPEFIIKNI